MSLDQPETDHRRQMRDRRLQLPLADGDGRIDPTARAADRRRRAPARASGGCPLPRQSAAAPRSRRPTGFPAHRAPSRAPSCGRASAPPPPARTGADSAAPRGRAPRGSRRKVITWSPSASPPSFGETPLVMPGEEAVAGKLGTGIVGQLEGVVGGAAIGDVEQPVQPQPDAGAGGLGDVQEIEPPEMGKPRQVA